jgi:Family of unknown function (DUF6263)
MNSRRMIFVVAALAGWSLTAAAASAQTTLRYKFKEGETLKYVLAQKMKMTMNLMGNNVDMSMSQSSDLRWNIQSVDSKGNAKIAIKFGRNKMSMDSPMGKIEVDSDNAQEPDDPIGQALFKVIKALAGLEIAAGMSPIGELTDVKLPEKAVKELQKLPGGDAFGDLLTPEGLKRMMSQSGLVMPQEAVEKGAKWKRKNEMKLPFGKMVAEVDYTYEGPADKDGRALEKITLKPKATIEPNPNAPFLLKLKSQDGSGTAFFDNSAGRLLELTNVQNLEMEIEVMGMAISQKMTQTMTMKLAK